MITKTQFHIESCLRGLNSEPQDDSVDSRITSSLEWSLDEMSGILGKLSSLVNTLHSRLQPKS